MSGPLDGFVECGRPGCPSWDDNATDDDVEAFEDSDGWAHGVQHVHFIDHWLIDPDENARHEGDTDAAAAAR
ncbi:hypothetical protein [Micromonospora sediminicola]|uniref:hypothetical protein n=1 Tax=Micromonospora sediminicola TaxID=946078 RepID=UPI0037BDF915